MLRAIPLATLLGGSLMAAAQDPTDLLARPSPQQYVWHEQERIMFVCLGIPTWMGTEYDPKGDFDLSKVDPAAFDADKLCEVAKLWGAQELLLVATHVGGFCWWPTETTEYCVRNTPWRGGKGDLVREVADACRRHGLAMGVYIYPDDPRYAAEPLGRGGRTDDPAKQDEWARLYRQQWEEVLGICGPDIVREVWFDGGCVISVSDIFQRLAPNAVVFQGPDASIRWVGNEAGTARDPNWNSLSRADLIAGATQENSTPDGDAWAPVECDTTLYDHNWFWAPANEERRKSLARLMDLYVQSVGRGSVLLLNSTPNTDGEIPEGDIERYREFGEAIERNFGHPLAKAEAVSGPTVELDLGRPRRVNCTDLWEDYTLGHRIRAYVVEGHAGGLWVRLAGGTAVGRRKMDLFDPVTVDRVRVTVTASVGDPVIRRFQVHEVDDALVRANVVPLSQGCPATASSVHSAPYEAGYLVDGDPRTRWGTADGAEAPWVEIDLGRPRKFARATASELADRIERFDIEFRNGPDEPWRLAYSGERIGAAWSADFPRVTGRFVRLHIARYSGPGPTLWDFGLYDRPDEWETVGAWTGGADVTADLSVAVNEAGLYEVRFADEDGQPVAVDRAVLLLEGREADSALVTGVGTETLGILRTQAVGPGAATALRVALRAGPAAGGVVQIRPR